MGRVFLLVLTEVSHHDRQVGLENRRDVRRSLQGALHHVLGNPPPQGSMRNLARTGRRAGSRSSEVLFNILNGDAAAAAASLDLSRIEAVLPNQLPDGRTQEISTARIGSRLGCGTLLAGIGHGSGRLLGCGGGC